MTEILTEASISLVKEDTLVKIGVSFLFFNNYRIFLYPKKNLESKAFQVRGNSNITVC